MYVVMTQTGPILGGQFLGGEHKHRQRGRFRPGPDFLQDLEPVHFGHHKVEDDAVYHIDGNALVADLPVPAPIAVLGGKVAVTTILGPPEFNITTSPVFISPSSSLDCLRVSSFRAVPMRESSVPPSSDEGEIGSIHSLERSAFSRARGANG